MPTGKRLLIVHPPPVPARLAVEENGRRGDLEDVGEEEDRLKGATARGDAREVDVEAEEVLPRPRGYGPGVVPEAV